MALFLLWLACTSPAPQPAPPPVAPSPAPAPPPAPPAPTFTSSVAPLPDPVRAEMTGVSWREGCPVGLDELRLVRVTHRTAEGGVAEGELVVAAEVTDDVVAAFAAAFGEGFPVERMERVDRFGGDDDRSMAANNTSAFNCRPVAGTQRWSEHAYGRAIDVNPMWNPYVRGERVDPEAGRAYLDRDDLRPGMLTRDAALVRTLRERGWGWGGDWPAPRKDYQHVSESGR